MGWVSVRQAISSVLHSTTKRLKSFALSARVPSYERDRPPGGPPLVTPQLNDELELELIRRHKSQCCGVKWSRVCV